MLCTSACGSRGFQFPTGIGEGASGGQPGGGSSAIAGTWRRTLVVRTQTDVITSETTWIFSAGGGCQRTVVSNSVLQNVPVTQVSPCSYTLSSGRVTIRFDNTSGSVSFAVALSGGSLFLDGVPFARI
jgi:hypothetical protein